MKYRIHYTFIRPDGTAEPNQVTPWFVGRDEANAAYLALKGNSSIANIRPEKVDETTVERHIVTVAFKTYDYLVEGPVRKGQYVTVLSGPNLVQLKVLEVDPPKKDGIDYKYVESVI